MRRLPNCNLFAALAGPGLQVICNTAHLAWIANVLR